MCDASQPLVVLPPIPSIVDHRKCTRATESKTYLSTELITRETEHDEPLILVLLVQRLEGRVLRGIEMNDGAEESGSSSGNSSQFGRIFAMGV